ncbi:MAG TPA: tRNA pseudouridine(38-40) synthase TruA [Rhodocyclaceae bacterium]|nr:tRNA pseudouridine(38-40) synthase TruA [Rhodocyclaceae bacterium]
MRIALGVEYDGSAFYGWQSQAGGNTVQDALEAALSVVAAEPIRVACAGRTDAGVHALCQVAHFDTEVQRPDTAWVRGVNANLPPTVAVRWAQPVDDEFHARFSAQGRRYRYALLNRPQRPSLWTNYAGWHHMPLDADAMAQAARYLLGEHDFSAFRAAECQAKSPIKTLHQADVQRHGDWLIFDFHANAFLHHMVRNLIGTLVYVGKGAHPPEWAAEVLASRSRTVAAPTFSAAGLYFAGVDYDPRFGLAGKIAATGELPFTLI